MSKLSAFLSPVTPEPKEVIVSDRFRDENGDPVPFKIRPLTQEENDAIIKRSKRTRTVNGVVQEYLDNTAFSRSMVLAATVEPNFAEKELCDHYGVVDPSLVPGKMLLSGEYARLMQEITKLSGFNAPVEDEAKN